MRKWQRAASTPRCSFEQKPLSDKRLLGMLLAGRKDLAMSEEAQEQTLFKGSSSPIKNLGTFIICGLIAVGALVFAFMLPSPLRLILGGVAAIALAYMLVRWLLIKVRVYEVTTERIRITNGLLTRRTDELELYRVKDTTLIEPLSMR